MPLVFGCSSSGDDDDDNGGGTAIASTPLAGKFGGQAWTMVSGDTDSFLSDETGYWATGYEAAVSTCSGSASSARELLLTIPKAPGDYPLGSNLTATFYDSTTSDNLIAFKGHIEVDSITASQITGGAYVAYDAANTVNGKFTISICP